jgi:nicotinate-nucleotide adenylyltransferase
VAGEPTFAVSEEEVHRERPSYTYDTIQRLRVVFPRQPFYFIVGSDNLREIDTWHRYRELLRLVVFCVAHRPGHSLSIPPSLAGGDFLSFPAPEWGISATIVRKYLAKGYRCRYMIPEPVREYIAENRLYSLPGHPDAVLTPARKSPPDPP